MPRSVLLFVLLFLSLAPGAGAQLPPHERWRTFDTEHFRIHYTEGLEPLARRAADRAETAYAELSRALVRPPRGRIDLVVADNVDFANGYATPFPTNRVVVYAHPPVDEPTLSFYDDWLQLVITHELVHVFHLDYAGGIWKPLRSVFGRAPFLFPAASQPGWIIEGLATHLESELTRAGRVRGTMHDMVLRTALLEDEFFSLDRATGSPATWPGGHTRYVYGSLFVNYLARRYGPERVGEFVRVAGGRLVPYRLDAAARKAFGVSFSRAWEEWRESLRGRYLPLADSLRAAGATEPESLTREGRYALFPRFSPEGERISYAAATGREEAAVRLLGPGGEAHDRAPLTTLGPASWIPGSDALLLAQSDYTDPYHVRSDLYRAEAGGGLERLTRGARLSEPHPAPDGARAVAVRDVGGTNVPVVVDLASGALRPLAEPSLDVHWSLPRWSPRGDLVAVGRWRAGGYYDVVVLDTAGRVVRELTRDRAVDNAPAWSPDGRYVLFSSDRTGIADLYAYDLEVGRLLQVTRVLTGAFQPDVSPDGRWIVFSHYRADGYHLARIPFDPSAWRPAPPVRPEVAAGGGEADYAATAGGPARRYSPWRSLRPSMWMPVVGGDEALGTGLGAATGGADLVNRHLYGVYALLYPRGRVEAGIGYEYAGLGVPVLELSADQEWSVFAQAGSKVRVGNEVRTLPTHLLERERSVAVGATFPRPRYRSYTWLSTGAAWSHRDRVWDEPEAAGDLRTRVTDFPPDLAGVLTLGYSSVRTYPFSISPQDGFLLSGTAEGHRYTRAFREGEDPTGYLRLVGRGRAYRGFPVWGFARHALAGRAAAGAETGSRSPGFRVGGAGGAPSPLPGLELGGSPTFPVRGYAEAAQSGNRAFSATAEYRFPVALVERGVRLLPVFLDRVWGDLFADVGAAWCADTCDGRLPNAPTAPRPLWSVGGELGVDFTLGYFVDLRLRGGVAVPLSTVGTGAGAARPDPELYLRFGRSF